MTTNISQALDRIGSPDANQLQLRFLATGGGCGGCGNNHYLDDVELKGTGTGDNGLPTISSISDQVVDEDASEQTVNLGGISAGGGESQPLRVMATSSSTGLIPNPAVTYTTANTTGSIAFTPVADQSGTATITVTVEDGGLDSDLDTAGDNATFSRTFDVTVNSLNDDPTLTALSNLSIDEDAAQQTVNLAGITAGGGESQPLRVMAISSSTGLIPNPTVTYTSANATGSFTFTPVTDQSGTATITVTVEDGGLDNNLSTAGDNATFSRTFDVTVNAGNDTPTLDALSNLSIAEDAAQQTVNLAGITAGGGESQPLRVTATSSNTGLIPNPAVTYTTANTTGSLAFTPVTDQTGTATITVTVEDGGLDGDLDTGGDNATFSRTFDVTVNAVNDTPTLDTVSNVSIDEDASEQTVNLSGISAGGSESQPLRVTASSSSTGLIPNPTVTYTSANAAGSIAFTPVADQSGTATITVTVEDSGLDGDLSTAGDNATFSRTFDVTVNPVNDVPEITSPATFTVPEGFEGEFQIVVTDPDTSQTHLFGLMQNGPDHGQLTMNPNTGAWRFVTPPDFENPADSNTDNVYEVIAAVLDTELAAAAQMIQVTVTNVNEAPVFVSWPTLIPHGGTVVGPVVATDEDLPAQTVQYSIAGGADAGQFSIGAQTGVLSFTSARDHGNPTDADSGNVYEVIVEADDQAEGKSTQAVSVTVIPPFTFDAQSGALTVPVSGGQLELQISDSTGEVLLNNSSTGVLATAVTSLLVQGTAGDDVIDLQSVKSADLPSLTSAIQIEAGDGDDIIDGSALGDIILAGPGDDLVYGHDGENTLSGEAGDDVMYGGAQADNIDGGDGHDLQFGMAGDDVLTGGPGDDVLLGAAGSDLLRGEAGNDHLRGQGGSGDMLTGGEGLDVLHGGPGTDRLIEVFLTSASMRLTQTELDVDGIVDHVTSLEQAQLTGGDGGVTINTQLFPGPVSLNGGSGADVLISGESDDVLFGFGGNDLMIANGGNDLLFGSSGRDHLNGGTGDDTLKGQGSAGDSLTGGPGADFLDGGSGGDRVLEFFPDVTNISLTDTQLNADGVIDVLRSLEQAELHAGDGGVVINTQNYTGATVLYGGAGDDHLLTGSSNDQLYGFAGDDTLDAGDGNDWLLGASGRDSLVGGSGNDVLR